MKLLIAFALLPLSTLSLAQDRVKILYDRTVQDVRVGVFEGQLDCRRGTEPPSYATQSVLSMPMQWVYSSHIEFIGIGLRGILSYTIPGLGDKCDEHLKEFAGHEFMSGTARRVVTERTGWRFNKKCWREIEEEVTLKVNGYVFTGGDQGITIGPVDEENCQ